MAVPAEEHRRGGRPRLAAVLISDPHYDVLRALDYLRATGDPPDRRVDEAVGLLRSKQRPEGIGRRYGRCVSSTGTESASRADRPASGRAALLDRGHEVSGGLERRKASLGVRPDGSGHDEVSEEFGGAGPASSRCGFAGCSRKRCAEP